jgi:hypothetical protein
MLSVGFDRDQLVGRAKEERSIRRRRRRQAEAVELVGGDDREPGGGLDNEDVASFTGKVEMICGGDAGGGEGLPAIAQTFTVMDRSRGLVQARQNAEPVATLQLTPNNDGRLHVTAEAGMTPGNGVVGGFQGGGVISPVAAERRTARNGRILPWALVKNAKSSAINGAGTGMSPPPESVQTCLPESNSYPPNCRSRTGPPSRRWRQCAGRPWPASNCSGWPWCGVPGEARPHDRVCPRAVFQ